MKHLLHLKKGFTLVELLIVISIMAILLSLGMYAFQTSLSKSRDQRRKTDIALVQGALESYRGNDANGSYPYTASSGTAGYTALATALVPTYVQALPLDPLNTDGKDAVHLYSYNPDCDANHICKGYTLSVVLENTDQSYVINQNGELNPTPTPGGGGSIDGGGGDGSFGL